ncbi:TonB-dependent receptor domain-containing protein [Silvibacterium acidisoli]|uniref:TonB-dependent receptor domain-containing protein n=1 Tax=Acidobacteriaceae bacterium ZG23-2 TaxID=2883246 RepID=UPI00406CFE0F
MRSRRDALCVLFVLLATLAGMAPAQSGTGGTVAGQVTDAAGRLFPALVTLRSFSTGGMSQVVCDKHGNFRFAEVAPGVYSIRVSAPGLAAWRSDSVIVEVGRITLLSPKLSIAYKDRMARPQDERPGGDPTPAITSNTSQQGLESFPLSDARWSSLAALAGGSTRAGDAAGSLSFHGQSPAMNGITLDGTDHSLAFFGGERGGSGNSTARAAIGEFQVNVSNFSAENGRATGGVINSVTRSGGNRLHGRAAFYDRGELFNAGNGYTSLETQNAQGEWITTPYTPSDHRMQWEASAGGPIQQNRLFWFFAYEQHHRNDPGVARANEPETFFAPPTAAAIATLAARTAQNASAALVSYNKAMADLGGLLGSVPRTANQWIAFPKIDWRPNNRNHLVAQVNVMRRTSLNGAVSQVSDTYGVNSFGNSSTQSETGIAGWEYFLTPTLLNSARYQYSHEILAQTVNPPTGFEQQLANNTLGLAPQVSVDRSTGFTFGTRASLDKPAYPDEHRQQYVDAVTWIRGSHALKAGFDYNYVTDRIDGLNQQAGVYSYSSVLNFVSDLIAPSHCDGSTTGAGLDPCYSYFEQAIGTPEWTFETADYAAFVADDWKLTRRFTLSLGLRYDYEDLPRQNKLLVNPDYPQTGTMPHDRNNYAPRAGFAWDLLGKGHTILRGGYGLYYGRVPNATVYSALTATGTATAQRSYYFRPLDTGAPSFPFIFSSTSKPSVLPTVTYFDAHFQNPQVEQASLSLQQELGHRSALMIAYLGAFSHELPSFLDANIDTSATGTLNYTIEDPNNAGPIKQASVASRFFYQRINPDYGAVTRIVSETNATYQAAMARLVHRMTRAMNVNVSYTWAHAIDNNQDESTFAQNNTVYDPTDLRYEHGSSNFDVRQRATGGIVLETPWKFRGFAGGLFNGYMLGATGEWHTGLPYSMRTMGSVPAPSCSYQDWLEMGSNCVNAPNQGGVIIGGTGTGPRISGLGDSLNGTGGNDILPQIGRNTYRYPAVSNLDVRASKTTHLSDRVTFEILGEAFNVMNHQNVTSIDPIGYILDNDAAYTNTAHLTYLDGSTGASGFGTVTNANSSTFYRQRQIQLGCKLIF